MTDKAYAVPLHELLVALRQLREENQQWQEKCNTYIQIHDAVVKDNERLHEMNAELVEALRARLATCDRCGKVNPAELHTCTPPQREWVGLTREELVEIAEFHFHGALSGREFYDDVEAKLKEKNT
jgi:hypothetical protein